MTKRKPKGFFDDAVAEQVQKALERDVRNAANWKEAQRLSKLAQQHLDRNTKFDHLSDAEFYELVDKGEISDE